MEDILIEGEDKAALQKSLNLLKEKLETSIKDGVETKIKAADEKLDAVQKSLKALEDKESVSPEEVTKLKSDLAATMKALDILQIKIKNAKPESVEEPKSFDVRLKEALENATDKVAKFNRKEIKRFEIELKNVGDMSTANITGSTNWGAQSRQGIIMNPNSIGHIRDFITVLPAGPGTDFYFMRENGVGEGSIAPVSEGALKPQIDKDLIESSVKFETIAGWLKVSRKALNNVAGLTAYLQKRLPEDLLNAEDAQILYGTGSTPQIKGILYSGNFKASTALASDVLVEKIIKDISVLEDTYKRQATGILLRPADYYTFFLNKASGSGEYDLPQGVSFVNGQLFILGVPVGKSTALNTSGTKDYAVGDFANGVDLMQQEAMRIEFFEQDDKNVQYNQVTVRIEETIALPVYGDNYFIKGDATYTAETPVVPE